MKHFCCTNCGFWQRRFAEPSTCPVCEDYRHPLPPDGYLFLDADAVAAQQRVHADTPLPGLTRFTTTPGLGIGSCGYLIAHTDADGAPANVHFDGCGWYTDAALALIADLGGVRHLAASHCHVFGALWRVAERFRPTTVFQAEALPFCQAFDVTFPFDTAWNLDHPAGDTGEPGLHLHLTAGHTPDHTVLHDTRRRRLYCGDALKFTFPGDGQTVGEADSVSCHRAYDSHIPLTHGDCRRYLALFESLDFDAVITPWEVVTTGGKAAALDMLRAQLEGAPFADPYPLRPAAAPT